MKKNKFFFLFVLAFFSLIVSSCGKFNSEPAELYQEETPTLPVSATQTLTLLPILTDMPIPLPTLTDVPTLPAEEARTRLLELLADNGNCQLPCLWGITPGNSTYQEARAILMPLSSSAYSAHLSSLDVGDISPVYAEENFVLYTRVAFLLLDNGIVSRISFTAEPRKKITDGYEYDFDSKFFREHTSTYMLSHILSKQGMPSAVLVSTLAGPPTRGGQEGFYLVLLYPEQGILIYYSTQWRQVGNNILGCLSNARVELELYPSGQGDSFSEFLAPTEWSGIWPVPVDSPNWKPIEKATSISLEQFYETFRQPTDKCIETPADLWPTPEP